MLNLNLLAEHLSMILTKHGVKDYRLVIKDPESLELCAMGNGEIDLSPLPPEQAVAPKLEIVRH